MEKIITSGPGFASRHDSRCLATKTSYSIKRVHVTRLSVLICRNKIIYALIRPRLGF